MNPPSTYDAATWDAMRQMHTLRLTDAQPRPAGHPGAHRGDVAGTDARDHGQAERVLDGWMRVLQLQSPAPPEAWTKLRLHTYHFTGDNYQPYLWGEPGPLCGVWVRQVADLPDILRLSEPVGGIGFAYEGRLISHDVIRFQHVVGTLHRLGVLERLAAQPHPLTLEIGSGYGGLAYHCTASSVAVPACCSTCRKPCCSPRTI